MQAKKKTMKKQKTKKIHLQPPQLVSQQITHSTTLRFIATTAINGPITALDVLDCILVATSATQGYDLFSAARIRYVEMWAAAGSATVPTTISLTYDANGNTTSQGNNVVHSDTVIGIARAAHVRAKPSKTSLASLYFSASSAIDIFSMKGPIGTVVDVGITFQGYNFSLVSPVAAQAALVGATAGIVYWRGLDGVATATTVLPPAGGVPVI